MYRIIALLASSRSSHHIQKLAAAVDCKSLNLRQIQRVTDACTAFVFCCGRLGLSFGSFSLTCLDLMFLDVLSYCFSLHSQSAPGLSDPQHLCRLAAAVDVGTLQESHVE